MSYKPTIIDAIISLKSDAKVIIKDEDYNTIVWEDGNPTNITQEQIETKLSELITEYDNLEYARLRKEEYPSIEELVVALYDDEDKSAIEAKRAEVKAKYPKWKYINI